MAILQVNDRPAHFSDNDRRTGNTGPQHPRYVTTNTGDRALYQRHIRSFTDPYQLESPGTDHHVNGQNQTRTKPQINWILTPGTTVGRALVSATQRLDEAGCDSARLDSQVLLASVLEKDRSWLFAHHEYELSQVHCDHYTELVARRIEREPVAYLLGRKEFYGLEFLVDSRVLIPRPETELLVDLVLAQISDRAGQKVVVADVGTGSGAIAVTVAFHAPETTVYALDISPDALDVARQNSARLTPENGPTFVESDLLSGLPVKADIIVANLPYIADEEYSGLQPDILHFEPALALQAGTEGLDLIEGLLNQLPGKLQDDGAVLLEIGSTQGEAVAEMARALRPRPAYVGVRRDYSGLVRMVTLEF